MTILPTPPVNWKRPAMPVQVKLQVCINQNGRDKETGEHLGDVSGVQFDHRPALWERKFDTEARGGKGDTIPPANDPSAIDAIKVDTHKRRTKRDAGRKAKEARCKGKKATRFRLPDIGNVEKEAAPVRKGQSIPSRPFDKTKSRGFDNQVRPRA